jgi:hypothetical protein
MTWMDTPLNTGRRISSRPWQLRSRKSADSPH